MDNSNDVASSGIQYPVEVSVCKKDSNRGSRAPAHPRKPKERLTASALGPSTACMSTLLVLAA